MKELEEIKKSFDKFCKQADEFIKKEKEKDVARNREEIKTSIGDKYERRMENNRMV